MIWLSCSFPVHNKGLSFWDHTDQTQVVAVFLLNLAANALCHSLPLRIQLVEHTALQVCISYQDPYSQFVAKSAAQRAAERAKLKLMGYDEQRIERQLQKLKEQQHAWEYKQYDSSEYNSCIMGSLHYYFIRFFNHLVQVRFLRLLCGPASLAASSLNHWFPQQLLPGLHAMTAVATPMMRGLYTA